MNKPHGYDFHPSSRFGPLGDLPDNFSRDHLVSNSYTKVYPQKETKINEPGRSAREDFHPSSRFGSQGGSNGPPSSGLRDQFDPTSFAQHNPPVRTTKDEFYSLPSSRIGPQGGRNCPPSSGLRDQYDPNSFAPHNPKGRSTKDDFHSLPSSRFGSQEGRNSPPSSGLREQYDPNSYEPHNIPGRPIKNKFHSLPSSTFGSQGGRNGPSSSGLRDQFDPNSFVPHNPPDRPTKDELYSIPSSRFGPQGGRNGPPSSGLRDQFDPNSFVPHNPPDRTTKDELYSIPSSRFGPQGGRNGPPSSGLRDQFDPNSFSRHNPPGRTTKREFDSHPARFHHQGGRISPTNSGLRDKYDSYTEHCPPGRSSKDEFHSLPSSRFGSQEQKDYMSGSNIRDQFDPDSYKRTFSQIEDRSDFPRKATKVEINSDHYSRHGPQEQKNILPVSSTALQGRFQNKDERGARQESVTNPFVEIGFPGEKKNDLNRNARVNIAFNPYSIEGGRNALPGSLSRDNSDQYTKSRLVSWEGKNNCSTSIDSRDYFTSNPQTSTIHHLKGEMNDLPNKGSKDDFDAIPYLERKKISQGRARNHFDSNSFLHKEVDNRRNFPSDELERDSHSQISSMSGFRKEKRNYTPGVSSRDDFFLKPHLVIPVEKTNKIASDKLHMNPYLRAGSSKNASFEEDYSSPSHLSDDDSPSREFSGEPDIQLQSKFPLGLKEGYFQAKRRFGTESKAIPEQKREFIKSRERDSSPACDESDRMMYHFQDRENYVHDDREGLENLQIPRESRGSDNKTGRFSSNAFKKPPELEYREKQMDYVFKEREYPPLRRQYDGDDSRSFQENVMIVETRTHRFDEPYETRQIVKKFDSYSVESKSLHRIQKNKSFIEKNKSRQMSPHFHKRSSFRPTSGEGMNRYSEYMHQSREGRNTEFSEYESDDELIDFIEATQVNKTSNEELKPAGIERRDVSKTSVSGGNDGSCTPVRPQTTSAERRTDSNSGSGQVGRGSPKRDVKDIGEEATLRQKEIKEKLRKKESRKRKRQAAARRRHLGCDDLTLPSRLRTLDPNVYSLSGDSDIAEDSRCPAEFFKESDSLSGNDEPREIIKKIECSDNQVTLEESEQHTYQTLRVTARLSGSQKKRYNWLVKNGHTPEEALEKCKDPIGTHKPKGPVIETKAANRPSLSKSGTDLSEKEGKHKKIVLDFSIIPPDVAELTMGVQGREKSSILDSLEDLEMNYQLPWLNGVQKTRYIWLRKRGYSSEEALEYSTDPSFSHLGKGNKRAGDSKRENHDMENKRSK